jgi:uncharacterized protein
MEQRVRIVTIGVADLARSRAFYNKVLGWKTIDDNEQIAFYKVGSILLALYPNEALAADISPEIDASKTTPSGDVSNGYCGFTIAHNLDTREAVDACFAKLRAAGVAILKEPHEVFWGGYSGYFADPDGNPWEVACGNPEVPA